MLFNSYEFIFVFLPIVLILYWSFGNVRIKLAVLTVSSYFFYAYWSFWFIFLMLSTTTIVYWTGLGIAKSKTKREKLLYLIISLLSNLGALAFFKYYNFFATSANFTFDYFGISEAVPVLNIILPVGISFYTFQSLSYTIDIYRGKAKASKDFLILAGYISMFPQLVAGPIVRQSEILYQFDPLKNDKLLNFSYDYFSKGLILFSVGMAKKILIADRISELINPMFMDYHNLDFFGAWAAMIGYTFQIYFDFSGYSDMAIGLGLFLGFKFPQNFNSPYKSENITEFWRRWHISLSGWLKDYLYIGLGGNRKGLNRTYVNLMITMLLGGLWHGASWNYVIWGGIHGILLATHKLTIKTKKSFINKTNYFKRAGFFLIIVFTWVFFRCEDLKMSAYIVKAMIGIKGISISSSIFSIVDVRLLFYLLVSTIIVNFLPNSNEIKIQYSIPRLIFFSSLLIISVLFMSEEMEFLYFQF